MSFDYRAYLKNNPLLEELPKNQWVDLDKKETEDRKSTRLNSSHT